MKAYQVAQFLQSQRIVVLGTSEADDQVDGEVTLENNLYVQVPSGKVVILHEVQNPDTPEMVFADLLHTSDLMKLAAKIKATQAAALAGKVVQLPYMNSAHGGMTAGQKAALTRRARLGVQASMKTSTPANPAYAGLTAGQKAALTKKLRAAQAA